MNKYEFSTMLSDIVEHNKIANKLHQIDEECGTGFFESYIDDTLIYEEYIISLLTELMNDENNEIWYWYDTCCMNPELAEKQIISLWEKLVEKNSGSKQ